MNLRKSLFFKPISTVFAVVIFVSFSTFGIYAQDTENESWNTKKQSESALVGRWESDEATIEIRANGSLTINGEEFAYKVKNSVITVIGDEGSMDFPFQLNGDKLIVNVEGRRVGYTRMKSGGQADKNRNEKRGGITTELIGKWCYISNVSLNSSNSRMSNRCFTLYENGTYEFYSETSSSGSVASSASQEYDSGRWSATENSITAYSEKHGTLTYRIEKRNHPKTGDPMLIVDGDAYVTAYKKEPW